MSDLKQVLNRRLFRHGGMLGPENPQGILNSSNELADVVRMQNGGFNTLRSSLDLDSRAGIPLAGMATRQPGEMGRIYEAPPVPPPIQGVQSGTAIPTRSVQTPLRDTTISAMAADTPASLADAYFTNEEIPYVPMWEGPTRQERLENMWGRVGENIGLGAEALQTWGEDLLQDKEDYLTSEDLGGTIPWDLTRTINDLQKSQPEFAAEIQNAAVLAIQQSRAGHEEGIGPRNKEGGFDKTVTVPGGDPSPEELRKQVATILYNTVERSSFGPNVAERIEAEGMKLRPSVVEDGFPVVPTVVEDDGTGAVVEEGPVVPTVVDDGPVVPTVVEEGTGAGAEDSGDAVEAAIETVNAGEGQEPSAVSAIAEVLGDPDQPIENKKKTIADYKQEFIDALPEYQGQTQFQKGMTIAKFGAAIMAGESPRAIKNIGDAFLAMGDDFTEDAEGKRAFEQAIELSSAKYSLAQINKDLDRGREDERAFHYFYNPKDPTDIEILTTADLVAGKKPGPNMVEGEIAKALITLQGVKAKAQQGLIDNAKLTEPERKRYTTEFRDASDAVTRAGIGKGLLKGVMEGLSLQGGPAATGALGFASQVTDLVKNVFNIKKTDYQTDGGPVSREAMLADIRKAFQLLIPITVGASQSANSISDRDVSILSRAVVANILEEDAAVGELLTGSEGVLFDKMQYSYNLFDDSLKKANLQMESLDNQFQNKLDYTYGDQGLEARRAGLLVEPYRSKPESAPTSGQIIKWQDYVNKPQWQEYSGRVGYNPAQYDPAAEAPAAEAPAAEAPAANADASLIEDAQKFIRNRMFTRPEGGAV